MRSAEQCSVCSWRVRSGVHTPIQERRSTAALQNASDNTVLRTSATLWSAAVLRRFSSGAQETGGPRQTHVTLKHIPSHCEARAPHGFSGADQSRPQGGCYSVLHVLVSNGCVVVAASLREAREKPSPNSVRAIAASSPQTQNHPGRFAYSCLALAFPPRTEAVWSSAVRLRAHAPI